MNTHIAKLRRKRARLLRMLANLTDHSSATHTFHGGWTLGYFQGQLTLVEDLLDDLGEE